MSALLPCPWCGSSGKLIHDTSGDYRSRWSYSVVCNDPKSWESSSNDCCGISGPDRKTESEAIATWNKRDAITLNPDDEAQVETFAKLILVYLRGLRWHHATPDDKNKSCEMARAVIRALKEMKR